MVILVDSREQKPYEFGRDEIVEGTERVKLEVGDYAVRFHDGSIPPIRFERKGLGDLFGTMTSGYARFKREMERAKNRGLVLILLVEGTLTEVTAGVPYSTFSGPSCLKKLFTLWVRYGLQPVFCYDRDEAEHYIKETFCAVGREYIKQGT